MQSYAFQVPPDGEFPVMNYRLTQEFKPPFRINTLIEEAGALKVNMLTVFGHVVWCSLQYFFRSYYFAFPSKNGLRLA